MKVYMVEVGVLLNKDDHEFESYNCVWDKLWGYYDENHLFFFDKNEAINYAKEYVDSGVKTTYAVVVCDDAELDEEEIEEINNSAALYEYEYFLDIKSYVYSLYKDENNKLHENFVKGEYE